MLERDGFCSVEVYPEGPLQLYVATPANAAPRLSVCPTQSGPFEDAVGAPGMGFTTTVKVLIGPAHPPVVVAKTVYTPAAAEVTAGIVGFCDVELKPFGPDQV